MLNFSFSHLAPPCFDCPPPRSPFNTAVALIATIHPSQRNVAISIADLSPCDFINIQWGLREISRCQWALYFLSHAHWLFCFVCCLDVFEMWTHPWSSCLSLCHFWIEMGERRLSLCMHTTSRKWLLWLSWRFFWVWFHWTTIAALFVLIVIVWQFMFFYQIVSSLTLCFLI